MKKFVCLLCQGKKLKLFLKDGKDWEYGIKGSFNLVCCQKCGLVSLWPLPSSQNILAFYPASYHSYNPFSSAITAFLHRRVLEKEAKKIKAMIGETGLILDVGCADGRHFDFLKKLGRWKFVGIDFNKKIVERGIKKGREIYPCTLDKFQYQKKFDLIIMDHLLEHVLNPLTTLKSAQRLLKKGGFLYGNVPNFYSLDRWLFGRYWGGFHLPRHLFHFTPKTLKHFLKKAGFFSCRVQMEIHTGHWALSVQNFLQNQKLTQVKTAYGRSFYYPFLLGFFVPLNFLCKLFKVSGIMSFSCKLPRILPEKTKTARDPRP